jgi:hypothetical protein
MYGLFFPLRCRFLYLGSFFYQTNYYVITRVGIFLTRYIICEGFDPGHDDELDGHLSRGPKNQLESVRNISSHLILQRHLMFFPSVYDGTNW